MKKLFLLLCAIPSVAFANFVNLDLKEQNINTTEVRERFADLLKTSLSSFVLVNERMDDIGFVHQNYQQYINGVVVENCMLFVHSKNGIVTLINGDILPDAAIPQLPMKVAPSRAKKIAEIANDSVQCEHLYIQIVSDTGFISHEVYKVCDTQFCKYIDVSTGEIVRITPLGQTATACSMPTMYSGVQIVNCEQNSSNKYILQDSKRNLSVKIGDMGYDYTEPSPAYDFYSSSTNWSGHYLTSVEISSVNNDWWETLGIGDTYPDLYITVKNGNNAIRLITDYKEDVGNGKHHYFPITFRLSEMINIPSGGGNYSLQLWDEDLGSDQLGGTLNFDANGIGEYSFGSTSQNFCGNLTISEAIPAFDVFWGLGKVIDIYQVKFNLRGFDGNGSKTRVFLHRPYSSSSIKKEDNYYNNAFAFSQTSVSAAYLYFGMGSECGQPQVGLNTVTHEYTHLVTAYRPNQKLVYSGESGAINEGYSDVMAEYIEYCIKGENDWLYDTDSKIVANGKIWPYVRNIKNPKAGGPEGLKPNTYKGDNWCSTTGTDDNGGVHMNNSVFTYWFYLLSEGGSGVNDLYNSYNISGIGIEKAVKIAWRMHREYLPANCTFAEARKWAIQSTKDFVDANLYGFTYNDIITVANAWYAVGVGEKDKTLPSGKYFIVAACEDEIDWFMSSDITSTSTKRLVADTLALKDDFYWRHTDPKFVWNVTRKDDGSYTIDNNGNYLSWTSGNSASLSTTPKEFGIYPLGDEDDLYAVQLDVPDAEPRFLSYNTANGLHYFAFYQNTNQHYNLYFIEVFELDSVTIRAKLPSAWGEDISCWVWYDDYIGEWKTPTKNGDWYEYSDIEGFNIIFVNGTTWSNDNNQTNDILSVYEDICIQVNSNTSGKRNYTQIDCPESKPVQCEPLPYIEPFSDSQGAFNEQVITGANGLTKMWTFTSAYGMKISGRVSGTNYKSESWLISPCINLTTAQKPILSFSHTHKFAGTPTDELTLWLSTNYTGGTPSSSTWKQLTIPTYATNTDWTFVSSGDIDLSAFIGYNVNIAWKYTSTASYAATWEVKNVVVKDAPQTSNLSTATQNVVALGNKSKIDIFGTQAGDNIDVYSAAGICILHTTATSEVECLSVPTGFYLVKIGQRTHKVVVR